MSKFAIGEQVENIANDHESGTVVAVFPTVDGSFRYAVDTEGYGALQFFAEEKLAWAMTSEGVRCHAVQARRRFPRPTRRRTAMPCVSGISSTPGRMPQTARPDWWRQLAMNRSAYRQARRRRPQRSVAAPRLRPLAP